jgi:hypothetical protein
MRSLRMDGDVDRVTGFLAEQMASMSDRGLGDVQLRSNLAVSGQSLTMARAARNLLTKARRDLAAGCAERAGGYIDRALRLPYNDAVEASTAMWEAHMILFTVVSEALDASPEGESAWLDAAEAAVPQCGERAREDLLQTLRTLDRDYRLPVSERRRIRVIAPGDGIGDVVHDRAGDDEATQRVVITELLLATTVYEAELGRLGVAG